MNRRAFLGAIGVILSAPAIALAAKFDAEPALMLDVSSEWLGECYETPSGETITGCREWRGELYVFTATSIFRVPRIPENRA